MTVEELKQQLHVLGYTVLKCGAHAPHRGEVCALEFDAHVRGREWSDVPLTLPDLRQLNDAGWSSDDARTDALLPVMAALWDWSTWSKDRRLAWVRRVAVETVRQIVADLSSLSEDARQRCREATTCGAAVRAARYAARAAYADADAAASAAARARAAADAARAAYAAADAAAYDDDGVAAASAAYAARAAAASAVSAARAAADAASADASAADAAYVADASDPDAVLRRACQIWIEAAKEGETK